MTECEICNNNCDHDINTIQTCSKCSLDNFHLILNKEDKKELYTILTTTLILLSSEHKDTINFINRTLERLK